MNTNFSKDNVEMLNVSPHLKKYHPYTCDGHDIPHCKRELVYNDRNDGLDVEYSDENEGVLIATDNGWICPCGNYTQDWFH